MQNNLQSILDTYIESPTYVVSGNEGSVKDYKYFLYPFKNFSLTKPQDEQFIAEALSELIDKDTECLVTFEADGIGVTKLISVLMNIPMIVCKPFHYNQSAFSFDQKTGYLNRKMYCPKVIEGKKISLVDCIVSTGGTISGFLQGLQDSGLKNTKVLGIYSVVNKGDYNNKKSFGSIDYRYLFNITIDEKGKVRASMSDNLKGDNSTTQT